ncbi:MAG TPA: glycosyltransferase family 1 protein [Chroococcidiopsis sp.]
MRSETSIGTSPGTLAINFSFAIAKATGLTTYAQNLFPYLQALDPVLLSSQPTPPFRHYPVSDQLNASKGSKGHLRRLLWTQFQLPQICQQLQSSLLFSPIPEAPLYAGCRSIVTVHDLIPLRFPNWKSPLTAYNRFYIPQVVHQAVHIICNSTSTADDFIRYFGVSPQKITPILLSHDSSHFQPLHLPTQPYFLYVGRFDPYKNLQRLILAFAQVSRSLDGELWLAGPDDPRYTPPLVDLAHKLGIGDRVRFLGYVDYGALPTLLNQAIALVFPSLWEGFGFPVLEAMACGTPVITSNLSSLPEVAGDAALLVNPYEVGEIARAMQQIATDDAMRSQLSAAGLTRASQFSWAKTGQATHDLLASYL